MFKLTKKDAKTLFDKDIKIIDVILVRLLLTHLLQMLLSKPRKTLENLTPFWCFQGYINSMSGIGYLVKCCVKDLFANLY